MPDPAFTVVALAGGTLERDFRKAGYDVANKAYLPIAGTLMLERVLRAFRDSRSVGRIRVVTQPDAFAAAFGTDRGALADDVIAPGAGLIDSMLAGLAGLDEHAMTLVTATDLPLLSGAAIDAFVAQARALRPEYDIGYGFVSRQSHMAKYPQVRHTWVPLREGVFCGGGVSVLRAGAAVQAAELLRTVAALRKSPLRLAGVFSPGLLVRLPFGGVRVGELEERADALSGLRCRGIRCDEPDLAVNVDRLDDLIAAEEILRENNRAQSTPN
ncbi:MAG TPA: nucleotidyltransferase family protein [Candidatus Eremiobacteraceae bacterium]|nr:nucleotidyltransferase family protein [Candidatus Eremiobacteraceae bacterium]